MNPCSEMILKIFSNFFSSSSSSFPLGRRCYSRLVENATAFTGKSDFYNTIFLIDDVILKLRGMKPLSKNNINWLSKEKMIDQLGFPLNSLQYKKLCGKLDELESFAKITEISQLLQVFAAHKISIEDDIKDGNRNEFETKNHKEQNSLQSNEETKTDSSIESLAIATSSNENENNLEKSSLTTRGKSSYFGRIDRLGRVISLGYRKTSVAKIFMTPGIGTCHVNGKLAINYFHRPVDMFKLAEPFRVTRRLGKYNVWALTKGGGETGKSGAISLAIARALATIEPPLAHVLYPWGCLKRDNRIVERKKPGQKKARRQFTWVKR